VRLLSLTESFALRTGVLIEADIHFLIGSALCSFANWLWQ
jgi:hypothetical protein